MKRPRHVVNTVSKVLCRSVGVAILLAVTSTAPAGAASVPRWAVAADSGATAPQSPAPAPATPPPATPPPVVPPPATPPPAAPATAPPPATAAPSSTGAAPADTTAARADTLGAPPAVAPALAPAAGAAAAGAAAAPAVAAPLTKKQQRELDKQKARDAKNAARKAKKQDIDPLAAWNRGKTWVMVRAGYAKSTEPGAASGAGGAGLGIERFLTARWALGLVAQGDLLGKFGAASEIEYPITLDITRHFRWQTALRPYLGAGGGVFHHEFFRTGADKAKWNGGAFLVTGANMPLTERAIMGIEGRMAFVGGDPSVTDPVFGPQRAQQTHYSIKLAAGLAF